MDSNSVASKTISFLTMKGGIASSESQIVYMEILVEGQER